MSNTLAILNPKGGAEEQLSLSIDFYLRPPGLQMYACWQ